MSDRKGLLMKKSTKAMVMAGVVVGILAVAGVGGLHYVRSTQGENIILDSANTIEVTYDADSPEYTGDYKLHINECVSVETEYLLQGAILTYEEYIDHFHDVILSESYFEWDEKLQREYEVGLTEEEKALRLEETYKDETANYIVLSYGNQNQRVDLKFYNVEYDDKNREITLHISERVRGHMASGEGYLLAIPTDRSGDYTCNVINHKTYEETDPIMDDMVYKPVIYLYPKEETKLEVILKWQGELTHTYPKYRDGWTVMAKTDGTLTDERGRQYPYLFWEGVTDMEYDFSEGFCVKGEDTAEFLEKILEVQGLSYKEQADFITYWLPQMEGNPYNIISFQGENYTSLARLETSCPADTEIRVFMAWKPSEVLVEMKAQEFTPVERNGFVLVEWGGTKVME